MRQATFEIRRASLFVFAFMLGASQVAHANASGRASELSAILKTSSIGELDAHARDAAARSLAHETCAAELAAHLLPRTCFRELAMSTTSKSGANETARLQRLSRICVQNAKASRSRLDLSGSSIDLPPDCRMATSIRLEDLQYIDEASSPETSVMRTPGPDLEKTPHD